MIVIVSYSLQVPPQYSYYLSYYQTILDCVIHQIKYDCNGPFKLLRACSSVNDTGIILTLFNPNSGTNSLNAKLLK